MNTPHTHERIHSRCNKDDGKIVLYWLEFTNPDKAGEDAFIGVAIVPAERDDFIGALRVSHAQGCNPVGSQVVRIEKSNVSRLPRRLLARLTAAAND